MNLESPARSTATLEEQAQFAASLMSLGAITDAFRVLDRVDPLHVPDVHLFSGFGHMLRSDYGRARQPLMAYINHPAPSHYEKLVARTNLVHVLVYLGELEKSDQALEQLLQETRDKGYKLLHANLLESKLHQLFWSDNLPAALRTLKEASEQTTSSSVSTALSLRQWQAIFTLRRHGNNTARVRDLQQIQTEAKELGLYESVRDCDIALAHMNQDQALWRHLLCGSRRGGVRKRIERLSGLVLDDAFVHTWHLFDGRLMDGGEPNLHPWIDLAQGQVKPTGHHLKTGQVQHRLLTILATDFYRPIRTAEIHEELFPDKFYHPRAAPLAVRQAIYRLRDWLRRCDIPLEIREHRGGYRLESTGPISIHIRAPVRTTLEPRQSTTKFASACFVQRLVASGVIHRGQPCSTAQAARALDISLATARRHLKNATQAGMLNRVGKGRATVYQLLA